MTAHNGLYEFIPYSVDELDILQGITLRIEKANCDILFFFDYLLFDNKYTMDELMHAYGTIAEAYQDIVGNILLPQKPLLTELGKKRICNNSWKMLHYVDYEFTYKIAETSIFNEFCSKYINLVTNTGFMFQIENY